MWRGNYAVQSWYVHNRKLKDVHIGSTLYYNILVQKYGCNLYVDWSVLSETLRKATYTLSQNTKLNTNLSSS
jgi:hypothetical protein